MMSDIRELYQEIIVDHGKNPRNHHEMSNPSRHANGFNPLCGDRVEIFLKTKGEQIIDISFSGVGCAISTASASLMTELIK
ncbi:MAG: iron-sulfur cluster assembly scaffold protein, partial [Gammaproteobacteria bacterium]